MATPGAISAAKGAVAGGAPNKNKKKGHYSGDDEESRFLRGVGVTKHRPDLTGHGGGVEETKRLWKKAHNKQHKGTDREVLEFTSKTSTGPKGKDRTSHKAVSRADEKRYSTNLKTRLDTDSKADAAYKKYSKPGAGGQAAFEKEFKDHEWGRKGKRRHAKTKHGNTVYHPDYSGTKAQREAEEDRQSKAKLKQAGKLKSSGGAWVNTNPNKTEWERIMKRWGMRHGKTHDRKTGKRL